MKCRPLLLPLLGCLCCTWMQGLLALDHTLFGAFRVIQPLPCSHPKTHEAGTCMFAWDCLNNNGTHLTFCRDRFYYGSCCRLPPGVELELPDLTTEPENSLDIHPVVDEDYPKKTTERPSSPINPVSTTTGSTSVPFSTFSVPQSSATTSSSIKGPSTFTPGLITWRPHETSTPMQSSVSTTASTVFTSPSKTPSVSSSTTFQSPTPSASTFPTRPTLPNRFRPSTVGLAPSSSTNVPVSSSSTKKPASSTEDHASVSSGDTSGSRPASVKPTWTTEEPEPTTYPPSSIPSDHTWIVVDQADPFGSTTTTGAPSSESSDSPSEDPNVSSEGPPGAATVTETMTSISWIDQSSERPQTSPATPSSSASVSSTTEKISSSSPFETTAHVIPSTTTTTTTKKPTTTTTTSTTTTTTTTTTEKPTTEKPTTPSPEDEKDLTKICGRPHSFPQARIVGGREARFGQWPWMISLRQMKKNNFLHKCGAALLNEFWAISAAHCVHNVSPNDILLRMGEFDLSSDHESLPHIERRIQIVATHPRFDPGTFEYDLALLRFYEPVKYTANILPICIPDTNDTFIGQNATVTGWGRLSEDGPLPSTLQMVEVPVISNKECESMYRRAGFIEDIPLIFICAGLAKGGQDSCEGDSGGPLVLKSDSGQWSLIGIISWGIGCALPNQPGVYTRITRFAEWVRQIIIF